MDTFGLASTIHLTTRSNELVQLIQCDTVCYLNVLKVDNVLSKTALKSCLNDDISLHR